MLLVKLPATFILTSSGDISHLCIVQIYTDILLNHCNESWLGSIYRLLCDSSSVICSIGDGNESLEKDAIKSFRVLRVLRPLKAINKSKKLKVNISPFVPIIMDKCVETI